MKSLKLLPETFDSDYFSGVEAIFNLVDELNFESSWNKSEASRIKFDSIGTEIRKKLESLFSALYTKFYPEDVKNKGMPNLAGMIHYVRLILLPQDGSEIVIILNEKEKKAQKNLFQQIYKVRGYVNELSHDSKKIIERKIPFLSFGIKVLIHAGYYFLNTGFHEKLENFLKAYPPITIPNQENEDLFKKPPNYRPSNNSNEEVKVKQVLQPEVKPEESHETVELKNIQNPEQTIETTAIVPDQIVIQQEEIIKDDPFETELLPFVDDSELEYIPEPLESGTIITAVDLFVIVDKKCKMVNKITGLPTELDKDSAFPMQENPDATKSFSFYAICEFSPELINVQVFGTKSKNENENIGMDLLYIRDLLKDRGHIKLFDVEFIKNENDINFLRTTANTRIVTDPDILIQTTDISKCTVGDKRFNHIMELIARFDKIKTGRAMIGGNIVNAYLDRILYNNIIGDDKAENFDDIFLKSILKENGLELIGTSFDGAKFSYNELIKSVEEVKNIYWESKPIVDPYTKDVTKGEKVLLIEPSFIAPDYGISGRADIMQFEKGYNNTHIFELKGGKAPNPRYEYVRPEHTTQIRCYVIALKNSIGKYIPNFNAIGEIFYSRASELPVRRVAYSIVDEQNILFVRNKIADSYIKLSEFNYNPLREILLSQSTEWGFQNEFRAKFVTITKEKNLGDEIDKIDLEYFKAYLSFTSGEHLVAKIGNRRDNGRGYSRLWKLDLIDKIDFFSIIKDLRIDPSKNEENFINGRIRFEMPSENSSYDFRVDDIVTFYPMETNGLVKPQNQILLKGTLKEINNEYIVITLRNKQTNFKFFTGNLFSGKWALEGDFMESGYNSIYKLLFYFFAHKDKEKKKLLYGLSEPTFGNQNFKDYFRQIGRSTIENKSELTENQINILNDALNSNDYYLLQGPPGTGKTSAIVKNLVRYLFNETDEKVMILAFTNMAIEEVAKRLREINIEYFKFGQSYNDEELSIRNLCRSESDTIDSVFEKFIASRVYLSTVAAFSRVKENLDTLKFDTIIVDEASQLVDHTLTGILIDVKRFIMIGDPNQLPPIAMQELNKKILESFPYLTKIGVKNLYESLFERLFRKAEKNGWNKSYGILTDHFRMHDLIADFISGRFYNNKLKSVTPRQSSENHLPIFNPDSEFIPEKLVADKRFIFINIDSEIENENFKYNQKEVRYVAKILKIAIDRLNKNEPGITSNIEKLNKSIGIITPFRAQIASINNELELNKPYENYERGHITIDTVERFQGSERDIIIVSLALNDFNLIKSLSSKTEDEKVDRKLNVTISRAKEFLFLLGNANVLRADPIYRDLIEDCENKGNFINYLPEN